jgi:pyruvate/2-oxoglutarate dehydrogenase complex dihydrolipoamide acyltransferase (E2) component
MRDVVVPKWGLTMEEATLVTWLCAPGDIVESGQAIAEIETDKAEGEVESPASGKIVELVVSPGAEVGPGQVIATIDDDA